MDGNVQKSDGDEAEGFVVWKWNVAKLVFGKDPLVLWFLSDSVNVLFLGKISSLAHFLLSERPKTYSKSSNRSDEGCWQTNKHLELECYARNSITVHSLLLVQHENTLIFDEWVTCSACPFRYCWHTATLFVLRAWLLMATTLCCCRSTSPPSGSKAFWIHYLLIQPPAMRTTNSFRSKGYKATLRHSWDDDIPVEYLANGSDYDSHRSTFCWLNHRKHFSKSGALNNKHFFFKKSSIKQVNTKFRLVGDKVAHVC